MTAAAFKAEFCDVKLIRTRKTVQVIFEVPVEQSNDVLKALGGMPNPGTSVWCAIARLDPNTVQPNEGGRHEVSNPTASPRSAPAQSGGAKHITNSWHQLSPGQQAGILCNEASFCHYLATERSAGVAKFFTPDMAADEVRQICGVGSRADIGKVPKSKERWDDLVSDYRAWMRQPEVVG